MARECRWGTIEGVEFYNWRPFREEHSTTEADKNSRGSRELIKREIKNKPVTS